MVFLQKLFLANNSKNKINKFRHKNIQIHFLKHFQIHDYLTEKYLNKLNKKLDVVVECRNQKEIDSAINFDFVNRILLDNYNPKELIKALSLIRGRKKTEASGRIRKRNIVEYAETGVDFVSIGELTNNIKSIDMSLKAIAI